METECSSTAHTHLYVTNKVLLRCDGGWLACSEGGLRVVADAGSGLRSDCRSSTPAATLTPLAAECVFAISARASREEIFRANLLRLHEKKGASRSTEPPRARFLVPADLHRDALSRVLFREGRRVCS